MNLSTSTYRLVAVFALVAVSLLGSCQSTDSPLGAAEVPLEMWEAERAVPMLGEDPARSPALVERIATDLARIRARFGHLDEMEDYRVYSPWYPDQVALFLTPEGRARLISGEEWPELDAVTADLGVTGRSWCGYYTAVLELAENHNPCQLCDRFVGLDGVVEAAPVWRDYTCTKACHLIWPQFTDRGMGYVFERRYESRSSFVYFHADDFGRTRMVGRYDPALGAAPVWWADVDPPGFDYTCSD